MTNLKSGNYVALNYKLHASDWWSKGDGIIAKTDWPAKVTKVGDPIAGSAHVVLVHPSGKTSSGYYSEPAMQKVAKSFIQLNFIGKT